jgi:hypothetical protein
MRILSLLQRARLRGTNKQKGYKKGNFKPTNFTFKKTPPFLNYKKNNFGFKKTFQPQYLLYKKNDNKTRRI